MNKYTIYCTFAQTQKAFELGAPIVKIIEEFNAIPSCYVDKSNDLYEIPTVEQMTGWLEEQEVYIHAEDVASRWRYYVTNSIEYIKHESKASRKEAMLAAIDAALDYLANRKED